MSDTPHMSVVDASVAAKWFLSEREANVAEAWELLEAHLAETTLLAAPDHMRLEVLNAVRSRGLPDEYLLKTADALDGFQLVWYPLDGPLVRAAAEIALDCDLTLYDAAFAALAVDLNTDLVTADHKLAASNACAMRLLGE